MYEPYIAHYGVKGMKWGGSQEQVGRPQILFWEESS